MTIRDFARHPPAPRALPEPGQSFVDPVFGTTLIYVGPDLSHAYSYYRAFSRDNKFFLVAASEVLRLYGLDVATRAVTYLRPLLEGSPITTPVHWDATFWDAVNPARGYVVEPAKQRIWVFDIRADGTIHWDVVRRFNVELPGAVVRQHSCSDDAQVWAFHAILTDGTVRACVWHRDINMLISYTGPASAPVNECQISPDGKYLRIFFNDASCVLWDVALPAGTAVAIPALTNHADWAGALLVCGDKINGDNAISIRRLDTPKSAMPIWSPRRADGTSNWSHAHHVSAPRGLGWVLVSDYLNLKPVGTPRPWEPFEGELFKVFPDGSVERLCHHGSDGFDGTPELSGAVTTKDAGGNPLGYWSQPRAAVSIDGSLAIFTSLISNRLHVFILLIPPSDEVAALRERLEEEVREFNQIQDEKSMLSDALQEVNADLAAAHHELEQIQDRITAARAGVDAAKLALA